MQLWQQDFQFQAEAPNLSRLFCKYDVLPSHELAGIDASLFASIGFTQAQELPIASYRYLTQQQKYVKKGGDGFINSEFEDNKFIAKRNAETILCADPVHLEVGLNDITLTDQITDLTDDEAMQCLEALNQHFKQDGLEFIYGSSSQWYLSLGSKEDIKTTPLTEVLRKNIAYFLPVSTNQNWSAIQNEIQMLLHSLPLNQKRESAGLPSLNSLWFYGGGDIEANKNITLDNNCAAVYGNNEGKGKLLSIAANCDFHPLPANTSSLIGTDTGKQILILDQLMQAAIYDDIEAYQKQLNNLDAYIEPLIKAWQSGKIELIIDSCTGKLIKPKKIKAWQFWAKKQSSLIEVANEAS